MKRKYDTEGHLTELAFFNADDYLVAQENGVAKLTQSFDSRGNLTESAHGDEQGNPVVNKEYRYAHQTRTYDGRQPVWRSASQ